MTLTVFRTPAPAYKWQTPAVGPHLVSLLKTQLIKLDDGGGVSVVPVYSTIIYQNLPELTRKQLHENAADVRSSTGAYTTAAYHLIAADQVDLAVWQWRDVQQQEIEQGQAHAALTLFRPQLDQVQNQTTREALAILCSQLERFTGNLTQAATDLRELLFNTPALKVEAGELAGIIANDQSNFTVAESVMRQNLRTAEELIESRMARIRKGLGWLHMRQRELDKADHELLLAQYEIDNLRGKLAFERCRYDQAERHYLQAQSLAEAASYYEGIAKTASNLGQIYLFRGQYELCNDALARAYTIYSDIGKTLAMAGTCVTQAVAQNQAGDHAQALQLLQSASKLCKESKSAAWMQSLIAHGRAEAFLGLGQLEKAETEVQEAIDNEELDILPDAYRVYGEIFVERNEYDHAHQAFHHALEMAQQSDDAHLCGYIWRGLSRLYEQKGETKAAQQARKEAIEIFNVINLPNEVKKMVK